MKDKSVANDEFGKSKFNRRKAVGLLFLVGVISITTVLYLFPLSTLSNDSIPEGPLSTSQIEQYTLRAFEKGYEATLKNDMGLLIEANDMLGKIIDSIIDNNFEFENYFTLRKTAYEYLGFKLSGEDLVNFEKQVRETYDIVMATDDEEEFWNYIRGGFASELGAPPGYYSG